VDGQDGQHGEVGGPELKIPKVNRHSVLASPRSRALSDSTPGLPGFGVVTPGIVRGVLSSQLGKASPSDGIEAL